MTRAHLQDPVIHIHAELGNTVMMITHDVDEAVLMSDRVVMITNGPAARSARSWTFRWRARVTESNCPPTPPT